MSTMTSCGIGVPGCLGVVFVTLKLVGVIDWPWWLVTLPLWFEFALALAIVVIGIPLCLWWNRKT
jgi:hypothetical protein